MWDLDPALQMGFDELLLESPAAAPTLRFYTWRPAALSLGYFQRVCDVPSTDASTLVVRRQTGGGAIHHVHELTFALCAALDDALFRGPVALSYERVHDALARAFTAWGVEARRKSEWPAAASRTDSHTAAPRALLSDRAGTGMCFHASTPQDLVWDQRKGVGSAQRRKSGRCLHHGSIKLGASVFDSDVAELWAHAPGLAVGELADAVALELAGAFGWQLEPDAPSPAELDQARERGQRFAAQDFVERR